MAPPPRASVNVFKAVQQYLQPPPGAAQPKAERIREYKNSIKICLLADVAIVTIGKKISVLNFCCLFKHEVRIKAALHSTSSGHELHWAPLSCGSTGFADHWRFSQLIRLQNFFYVLFSKCLFGPIMLCAQLNTLYCILLCIKQSFICFCWH